jgi:hypothetical protein
MIAYILGTVAVVFGGIALLVFLALSSNRGASVRPQSPQTQQPQGDTGWKKWGERIGWGVFGLVLFDVYRKIFGSLPVEWKEWVPGFSWNTFEILALIAGVIALWGKWKEKTTDTQGIKAVSDKNSAPKENHFAEQMAAVVVLMVGLFFWGAIPYEAVPPVPAEGMLYIPLWGLLKAAMVAGLITLLWSFFCETRSTNGAVFAVFLMLAGLIIFFLGIKWYWFAPISSDPLADTSIVLGGATAVVILVQVLTKNIEYTTITILAAIAIWLPQMTAKSPGLTGLAHAVFS